MSGRTFTPEFKRECAELVIDHGYTVTQAYHATEVGTASLGQTASVRAWRRARCFWHGDIFTSHAAHA
ncbi:transposase [Pantoea sp.]|uniref:transposase n=1 Tax=Pantoea sp. TaxID=69393 RepID=UPI0028AF0C6C|nr:transposase [Pantoea sp.]